MACECGRWDSSSGGMCVCLCVCERRCLKAVRGCCWHCDGRRCWWLFACWHARVMQLLRRLNAVTAPVLLLLLLLTTLVCCCCCCCCCLCGPAELACTYLSSFLSAASAGGQSPSTAAVHAVSFISRGSLNCRNSDTAASSSAAVCLSLCTGRLKRTSTGVLQQQPEVRQPVRGRTSTNSVAGSSFSWCSSGSSAEKSCTVVHAVPLLLWQILKERHTRAAVS